MYASPRTSKDMYQMQQLPLGAKVSMTKQKLVEWGLCGSYASWSGGKDSTVLKHIIQTNLDPYNDSEIPFVFVNTGLEYPEIQQFVSKDPNVQILRPKMRFDEVISTYGYPLIGKEVAEAIYYSRRIDGGIHSEKKTELQGTRMDSPPKRTARPSSSIDADGYSECTPPRKIHRHYVINLFLTKRSGCPWLKPLRLISPINAAR